MKKNAHSTTDSIQQPSTLIHIEISSVLFFWLHCMATLRVNKQKGNKHTQFNKRKWKTQFHFVAQMFFFSLWPKRKLSKMIKQLKFVFWTQRKRQKVNRGKINKSLYQLVRNRLLQSRAHFWSRNRHIHRTLYFKKPKIIHKKKTEL